MSNPYTIFKVYTRLPYSKNWFPFKHYRSKQAALNRIAKYRERSTQELLFKIIRSNIWNDENDRVVYDESEVI